MAGMRLRIKDVDFDRHSIIVREAKGGKDRVVMLPRSLTPALRVQLLAARTQWETDKQSQRAGVEVPHARQTNYAKVSQTWGWCWMFPSPALSIDPRSGIERRHHLFVVAARLEKSGSASGDREAGVGSHFAPQFCDAPPAVGNRHSHGSGVAGPQ